MPIKSTATRMLKKLPKQIISIFAPSKEITRRVKTLILKSIITPQGHLKKEFFSTAAKERDTKELPKTNSAPSCKRLLLI